MELKIEHISKQFKDKTAVDDVSLTLTTGVWGLLGANGAGKTTLMRILADIMTPSIVKNVGQLIYVHYVMLIATMLMDYIFHIDIIHVETKESIWKTI